MREDDYTGRKIDDGDELSQIEEALVGSYEIDLEEDALAYGGDDENETLIHIGAVANGAKSLREAAEMLYDMADELLAMSAEGWEIVDDIANGHGTAVRFDVDESDELDLDGLDGTNE